MSNLFLKPSAEIRDHDFKKKFFEEMEKTSEEIWFFENEPTNIYLVLKISPHVNIVFVDTVHSPCPRRRKTFTESQVLILRWGKAK